MLGFAVNEDNDIYLDRNKNIAFVRDMDALKIAVESAIKTNYGEIRLNTQKGVPYFSTIFQAHPDIELWKTYVKEAVLNIENVLSVAYFKTYIDYKTSLLKYAIVIETVYGQEEISNV